MNNKENAFSFHYEKLDYDFHVGEVIENFNGRTYQVMEMFTPQNILLMDQKSREFVVAVGMCLFARTPKDEPFRTQKSKTCVEWQHGIYLGRRLSDIDFAALRMEYGYKKAAEKDAPNADGKRAYCIEITETLQHAVIVEAENLAEAMDLVGDLYYGGEVVLDAEDMTDVTFGLVEASPELDKKEEKSYGR